MNLGQVYTKRMVADFMTSMFSVARKSRILDPCFGRGVFVRSVLENTDYLIDGVEIDEHSFRLFENPAPARCTLSNGDFFDIESEYDGVIMNPPYVRQEEIEELASLGITKRKLQSACSLMSISSKANLYMYFILRAILLLRNGGELIAIFPNSWTNTPVGCHFREQINHHGCITDFINVQGEAFEGSPMVDVCILKFVKGLTGTTKLRRMCINGDTYTIESIDEQKGNSVKELVRLKSVANIRRGITTGANKLFVNPPLFMQDHLVGILSSPKDFEGYTTKLSRQDKLLAIQKSEELTEEEKAYLQNCANIIIREGKPLTLKNLIKSGTPWYFISIPATPQIVFSYIVRNNLKFVLNEGKRNVRDNFYMISSSYDPYLLLSLLNNYHVYSQLERCGKSYGKGVLKLQKYDIDGINVPRPEWIAQNEKERLIALSKELVATSDTSKIDEITTILSPFYGAEDAKKEFIELKKKRLAIYE